MKRKLLIVLAVVVLCIGSYSMDSYAADTLTVKENDSAVSSTDNTEDYTEEYKITNDNANVSVSGSTDDGRIIVEGNNVTITLDNVFMILDECNGSPIEIAENKSATLILKGRNSLTAYADGPGILVNQGATLTIKTDADSSENSLTVNGAQMARYTVDVSGGTSGGMASGFAGIGGSQG